jgi:hypothetical protein
VVLVVESNKRLVETLVQATTVRLTARINRNFVDQLRRTQIHLNPRILVTLRTAEERTAIVDDAAGARIGSAKRDRSAVH